MAELEIMSLVMFTARAGATCPIPVKALESGAAAALGSPLRLFDQSEPDLQSTMQGSARGEGTRLPDVLLQVQRILGIREQCTNY